MKSFLLKPFAINFFNECYHPRKEIGDWVVLFVVLAVNQVLFGEMKVVNQLEWGKTHSSPIQGASPSWAMHKPAN